MKILLQMEDVVIEEAARLVAFHYGDYKFLEKLRTMGRFNHTNHTGHDVAKALQNNRLEIIIRPYKTFSPWSKVIGYAKGNVIFVNTRKLDLPLRDRVENLMHEALHLLGYQHNGNRVTPYNLGTVPYKVAAMFADYVMEKRV
jgi:predicted metallopeptidase